MVASTASRAVAVALIASWVAAGCSRGAAADAAAAPPAPPPLPVTVLAAVPSDLPFLLEAVGQTEGSKQIEVRARVSGILERTLYKEGDAVRAGATLFQIDRKPFEIAVEQAGAALSQEQARLEQADREAARLKALLADRSISQREYDDADATAKAEKAAVDAAAARLHDAQLNLSYTSVVAPIGGITSRAQRSDGTLVTVGSDSALLTTIAQTDPIWVRFALSEQQFARLRGNPGRTEVKLVLPDGSTYAEVGRVNFTGSTVDERLGTVQLRAEFRNAGLALLPGQFVRVQVYTGSQHAFVVPQRAVVQNDRGRFVWVVDADGKAQQHPVETGRWVGSDWLVFKGIAPGDRVIVDNLIRLRPGAAVTPKPAAPAAGDAATPAGDKPKSGG
ncbi:MAG TPA: efflux RND transporter periplasmic adaptor subunit [Burkholderiaceae bacterium]|nr:efflux RND transporter periplasmic adaptor subunit [Burkholderiaceae bacterium]